MVRVAFPKCVIAFAIAFLLTAVMPAALAQEKPVRLRNGTRVGHPSLGGQLALQSDPRGVSGLFLVQFHAPPSAEVRSQLEGAGVRLLRYVPDDTFIARFERVNLRAATSSPGVAWIGEYRADDKVATVLRDLAAAGNSLSVAIAVAPGASIPEQIALRRTLQRLERESHTRHGNILQGRVTPTQLAVLARSPAVLWLEPAPRMRLLDEIAAKIVAGGEYTTGEPGDDLPDVGGGGGDDDDGFSVAAHRGLSLHALPPVPNRTTTQQLGFDGTGVTIAVADSGLDDGRADGMHPDLEGRVDAFLHYGTLEDASDEHGHGTHVAGIIAGDGATGEKDPYGNLYGLGIAPNARIVAQRIFDGIGNYEPPPSMETLTRDAVRAGAVIGSNSWGDDTQGTYDLSAAEFDALVRDADALAAGDQPYILEFSAGNAGPGFQTINSPAVAKNVIATGASQNDRYGYYLFEDGPEAMADFSSRGPCKDGRIKPDVVAPGTWIASLQSSSATDENAWSPISPNYQYQGGTSQSGPQVSGAAAVFVQFWRETRGGVTPSPALVKAALINSAVDLDDELGGTGPIPNMDEGWGRVTLTNLIGSLRGIDAVDQTTALTNGQVFERRVLVGNPRLPLKITLAYTDVPGIPAAAIALVNDLDLEVIAPNGSVFRGNAFNDGESVPDALASDTINNVEAVHIAVPDPGEYLVRIRGTRVVEDVFRRPLPAEPAQDFALVTTADLPLPGQGIVVLNRAAYTAPSVAQIRLIDINLNGQGGVDVQVRTDTESPGETVRLGATSTPGVFTGTVALVTGSPISDGRIQVADGDTLVVTYEDAAPAATRNAEAVVDLQPPTITSVSATSRFGRFLIQWETNEETDAIVDFGDSPTLGLSTTNRTFGLNHAVRITDFPRGQRIYYRVRSRDPAGNERVADAGGQPFQADPVAAATVLLVDEPDALLSDYFNVATYTEALDALGVSHEIWSIADEGRPPGLEELSAFPVVIWRVAEFSPRIGRTEARAITDYIAAGGSLFIASMEILSRLDESGLDNFRRSVLHVENYDVDPGLEGGVYGNETVSMTADLELALEFPDLIILPLDFSDTFRVTTNATPILYSADTGRPAGVRFPRTGDDARGRVVFFAFPLEAIPADADAPNNREEVLHRVLQFLAPAALPGTTLELDRQQYTLPSLITIDLADQALARATGATVRVTTSLDPAGITVPMQPTARSNVFRARVPIVAENASAGAPSIKARDGDSITVEYRPSNGGLPVEIRALVDVHVPAVSDVAVKPEYTQAVVSWTTSEPTDALVKYFKTGFPNNLTAYQADFTDTHELVLTGLEPDREYSFEVVCRDPAGNSVTDNNSGKAYTFRTLRPLTPPYVTDLETGATNWTVVNSDMDEETLSILVSSPWRLGQPDNELATSAHSGVNAWGTNLRGEANDFAESWLISPAILLSGGNRATLRFWHAYDFLPRSEDLDILEYGELYVTTNNGAAWSSLKQFSEANDGWEPEELDLSSYLGQTVRLAWGYILFSLDTVAHPGWLVDDVSVTVSQFTPASLFLSNNLHAATVTLSGPINRVERGRYVALTNAPPGEYQLTYGDVAHHIKPADRTVTVPGGQSILVPGVYTFPDSNGDGISDLWEQQFHGAIDPGHRPDADRDADGASDLAEFMAGTNPTNAVSRLQLLAPVGRPGGRLQLRWESSVGHAYRVESSAGDGVWAPETEWIRAAGTATTTEIPGPGDATGRMYRLRVEP